jgi:hypothetical protein
MGTMEVMTQSRTHSAFEAVANVAIGYGINVVANLIVLPAFGFNVSIAEAAGIGVVFTAISLARSYLLRRLFNKFHGKSFFKH